MLWKKGKLFVALIVCCFECNSASWADEKLPPMEVRATVADADAYSSPVTAVINPEKQIPAGQINDLTDLLKLSNAIYIQDSSYGKQLFLRGMSDQEMRILINGMPLGQLGKYYARSVAWEAIPMENIERIEVIRGAGSAEYGNTLAGTINIITKKGKKASQGAASVNYGTFNDFRADAANAGSTGKLNWTLGGAYRNRDEYLNNNDIAQWNANGSLGMDMGPAGELQLTAFTVKRQEGLTLDHRVNWNVWSDSFGFEEGSTTNQETHTLIAAYTSGWLDLSVSYIRNMRDDDYVNSNRAAGDYQDYSLDFNTPAVKAKLHHKFGDHRLKLGAEYACGDARADWVYYMESAGHVDWKQDLAGAFLEDSWQIRPKINLTLGLRYDYFENRATSCGENPETHTALTQSQWSPRASLTHDLPADWQVFVFAGRVFKAPTLADLYRWHGSYSLKSFAGRAVLRSYYGLNQAPGAPAGLIPSQYIESWQNLIGQIKPVKGWDYEVGLRHSGAGHAIQANLFYQDLQDYINVYPVSYPPTYNVDHVRIWGLELSGVYTINDHMEAEAVYTWMENEKEGDKIIEKIYGKNELFNAPDHILNLTLRSRPVTAFSLEWQSRFVSGRFAGGAPGVPPQAAAANPQYNPMYELDAYWLHNLRASYTIQLAKTDVTFCAAVENIFNEECYIRLDYPLPGTLIYGGVKFTF